MIMTFKDQYAFLSNFYPSIMRWNGQPYLTAEHLFQAQKTNDTVEREYVRTAPNPAVAKARGRRITLRQDWNEQRLAVMKSVLETKFQEIGLANLLMGTGDIELVEGNWWGDRFWGQDLRTGEGFNHLGRLLMELRVVLNQQADDLRQ